MKTLKATNDMLTKALRRLQERASGTLGLSYDVFPDYRFKDLGANIFRIAVIKLTSVEDEETMQEACEALRKELGNLTYRVYLNEPVSAYAEVCYRLVDINKDQLLAACELFDRQEDDSDAPYFLEYWDLFAKSALHPEDSAHSITLGEELVFTKQQADLLEHCLTRCYNFFSSSELCVPGYIMEMSPYFPIQYEDTVLRFDHDTDMVIIAFADELAWWQDRHSRGYHEMPSMTPEERSVISSYLLRCTATRDFIKG